MQSVSFPHPKLRSFSTALFLGVALLWSVSSQGADNEKTRWYDVEVIIFSQTSQQYRDSEMWPMDYNLPQMEASQELLPAATGGEGQSPDTPIAFTRLDKQSLRLNAQAERVDAAPDTELLLHLGWRQPGLAEDQAIAVRVDDSMQEGSQDSAPQPEAASATDGDNMLMMDTAPAHRMEGTLKLVLSRYLHIYTDLIYREPLEEGATLLQTPPAQTEVDLFNLAEDPFSNTMQPRYQVYHLQQSRRMRSKEMHYLDHPILGMVILVTPYEVKEADTDTAPAE